MAVLSLNDEAVRSMFTILDDDNDGTLTTEEAVNGINLYIWEPLSNRFPGITELEALTPDSLSELSGHTETLNVDLLKMTLEQYLDYLARHTSNPQQYRRQFYFDFDTGFTLGENQIVPAEVNNNNDDDELAQAIALSLNVAPGNQMPEVNNNNDDDELAQAIALSLNVAPGNQRTLDQLNNIIQVFDPILAGENVSATLFLQEQHDYNPFIVRSLNGNFHGNATNWPAGPSGKYWVECSDDAPASFQGLVYSRFIKPNGRRFVKILIGGSPTLVITPPWYIIGNPPGTRYFNLVPAGNILKFMSQVLASDDQTFNVVGADHCNQTGPVGIYTLQEITLAELNNLAPIGGKKNKKNNTKKQLKIKNKYHKFTKKEIKKLKKIRKTKINKKSKKSKKSKKVRFRKSAF